MLNTITIPSALRCIHSEHGLCKECQREMEAMQAVIDAARLDTDKTTRVQKALARLDQLRAPQTNG